MTNLNIFKVLLFSTNIIFAQTFTHGKKYMIMKRLLFSAVLLLATFTGFTQETGNKKIDLSARPSDHIMVQVSSDRWLNAPDSIDEKRKGSSRGANIYLMLDKPFKSNPKLSVAFGLGISTSHVFFDKLKANIDGNTPVLNFESLDSSSRYKKYKVSTSYLELPLELRYTSNPEKANKSFKMAVGLKVATLVNAHTKGKELQNSTGTKINDVVEKINSKSYFNTTRIAATARVGIGNFSIFGAYNLSSSLFKDNTTAPMKLLQVGLTLSGL